MILAGSAFTDQVAVVTGGGTGIGLEIARGMHHLGAKVALIGRRQEVVVDAAADLDSTGKRAIGVSCDIRDPEQIKSTIASIVEKFGRIDLLVNNAGGQFFANAEDISPNGFASVVQNNLIGTWNMTHAVATQAMIPQSSGAVVNIIANVARGFPGMAHTGAARAGVDNLTKTLAVEWARYGIRVNAIAPGVIKTPALSKYPPEVLQRAERAVPLSRLGTPDDIAQASLFLCSSAATYVTGVTLYVDGAASLHGRIWTPN